MRCKALLLVLALAWALPAQAGPLDDFGVIQPKTRMSAPEFSLPDMDGNVHSLSSYRGKVVVLHFWATWCAPCRQEMPALHDLAGDLKDNKDLVLLLVNVDRGSRPAVNAFMQDIEQRFQTLLNPDGDVRNAYAVRALPTTYLIGRDGKFSGLIIGERNWSRAAPMLEFLLGTHMENEVQ